MDGPFLDLSAESIEGELDDYWHELYKVQKLFISRKKKVQADRLERKKTNLSLIGSPRDPPAADTAGESNSRAASATQPNNTATLALIVSIQERMKDFKVSRLMCPLFLAESICGNVEDRTNSVLLVKTVILLSSELPSQDSF
jgi:hypothetical protein